MFIINRIFTDDNPLLTKKQYSEFINRYFENAKKVELSYEDEPFDFNDFC